MRYALRYCRILFGGNETTKLNINEWCDVQKYLKVVDKQTNKQTNKQEKLLINIHDT